MALSAADLAGTTEAARSAARTALVAYLQPFFPTLAIRAGQLADLALGVAGAAAAAVETRAEAVAASVNPEEALAAGGYDAELLDAVLAGRGVTRRPAAAAAGVAALKFSDDALRTVPAGYRLRTADGVGYATASAYRVLPTTGSVAVTGDVVLVADPAGGYAAPVAVTADATGATANRPAGTALTPASALANQTGAYLSTDAAGGADAESDAALLLRLPAATAPRTAAAPTGAVGLVTDATPSVSDARTLGFGEEGMARGRSVLTGQQPGCLDVWVREAVLGRTYLAVTATLVDDSGPYGVWQFAVGAGDAPGWLFLEKVVQAGSRQAAGYQPSTSTFGYDLSGAGSPPNVTTAADAAFTRYATATFRFTDPDTSISGLTVNVSTRSYEAVLRSLTSLDTAQDAVEDPAAASSGGDCLVRGACPVTVEVTATVRTPAGVTLTTAAAATAVAAAVNATPINNRLSTTDVVGRAAAFLPAGCSLQLSDWAGRVYPTTGAPFTVSGTSGLEVSADFGSGLGPKTVAFYADPEDVDATVQTP